MREEEASESTKEVKGLLQEALFEFKRHSMLLFGGVAWWGSHYLLLWNAHITAIDSFASGYDGRFVLSIAGTILVLFILTLMTWRKPQFELASHVLPYVVFGVCTSVAFGLLVAPSFIRSLYPLGFIGAVLSGLGNSFMLVLYGELHVRMGIRFMPLAFAVEVITGVILAFILSQLPVLLETVASAGVVVVAAVLCFLYSRKEERATKGQPVKVDMSIRLLLVFAVLTGFAYGLVRTFAVGGLEEAGMHAGLDAERWGTCLCALLLLVIFFLQKRQTLFEQCLLLIVPLVATGMLLVSLQGINSVIPTAINTGGFACFFILMWYFAAVLATHEKKTNITFFVTLLFLASQSAQFLGALVPAELSNSFSSALVYLLLLFSMIIMYWRSKALLKASGMQGSESAYAPIAEVTPEQKEIWVRQFGFSPREAEIAVLLVQRTPYKQIGEELYVSGNTVKTHVRNVYKKADVSSREELLEKLSAF
ncbi:response regulator transcription factor [Eggerthella sp. YY7918]|uniref:response regulator transcription factor n=1 Tax=Eggerthella sp. (strain YY7918) TaxID=502558 RepID=UPI00021717E7|nr:helix-turn-helix transcriptional regulator [Eggerthella sp. YY7918]BAK45645.1 DNA-binding HTH domain-containing protein [Eggerthella sp. YY7918]